MLARQYALTTIAQVIQTVLAVATLFTLARVLEPLAFGQAVLLATAVTLGTIAISAGLQAALLIQSARDPTARPALHGMAVVASVVAGISIVGAAILFAGPLHGVITLEPAVVVMTAARLGPAMYAALMSAGLGGAGRIGRLAFVNVANGALGLLAPIGAYVGGGSLAGAVAGALGGSILLAVCAFGAAGVLGLATPRRQQWVQAVRIGLPLHIGTIAYWIMLRSDGFVINAMIGGGTVGLYALALSLSERVSVLASPLYNASAWRISGGDPRTSLAVAVLVARIEIGLAVVLAVAAWIIGPAAIGILAGQAYVSAAGPTTILVIGAALLPVWASFGLYLASHMDGAWFTARTQVTVAILAVLGYVLLVPGWGMSGAALVSTGAYILLVIIGLHEIRLRQPFPLRTLLPRRSDVAAVKDVLRRRGSPQESQPASRP